MPITRAATGHDGRLARQNPTIPVAIAALRHPPAPVDTLLVRPATRTGSGAHPLSGRPRTARTSAPRAPSSEMASAAHTQRWGVHVKPRRSGPVASPGSTSHPLA